MVPWMPLHYAMGFMDAMDNESHNDTDDNTLDDDVIMEGKTTTEQIEECAKMMVTNLWTIMKNHVIFIVELFLSK